VSVGAAYFQVLSSQDRLRIARENLAAANRVLTLVKQRFEAGTASRLDVAQQESLVAQVRATIPLFDQTLRQNIAVLAVLIGRPPVQVTIKGGSSRLRLMTPGLPSELLFQRPTFAPPRPLLRRRQRRVRARRLLPAHLLTAQAVMRAPCFKVPAGNRLQPRRQPPAADGFRRRTLSWRAIRAPKIYCQGGFSATWRSR
jgi:hypothetical protein